MRRRVPQVAAAWQLTAYDAAYLALAELLSAPARDVRRPDEMAVEQRRLAVRGPGAE